MNDRISELFNLNRLRDIDRHIILFRLSVLSAALVSLSTGVILGRISFIQFLISLSASAFGSYYCAVSRKISVIFSILLLMVSAYLIASAFIIFFSVSSYDEPLKYEIYLIRLMIVFSFLQKRHKDCIMFFLISVVLMLTYEGQIALSVLKYHGIHHLLWLFFILSSIYSLMFYNTIISLEESKAFGSLEMLMKLKWRIPLYAVIAAGIILIINVAPRNVDYGKNNYFFFSIQDKRAEQEKNRIDEIIAKHNAETKAGSPPGSRRENKSVTSETERHHLNVSINLSDEVVMVVKASRPLRHRGAVFNRYDGHSYSNDISRKKKLFSDDQKYYIGGTSELEYSKYMPSAEKVSVEYNIKQSLGSTIYTPYRPDELDFPSSEIEVDNALTMQFSGGLTEGTVYTVEATVPKYERSDFPETKMSGCPSDLEPYCGMENITDDMINLARNLTLPRDSDFKNITAIADYLKSNYTYDLKGPQAPPDSNTIHYFLFESKRGYCQHFATALALLSRAIGIPSRIVTGFGGGAFNQETGYYEITGKQSHAWTEIYFQSIGWVPFDATPADPENPSSGSAPTDSVVMGIDENNKENSSGNSSGNKPAIENSEKKPIKPDSSIESKTEVKKAVENKIEKKEAVKTEIKNTEKVQADIKNAEKENNSDKADNLKKQNAKPVESDKSAKKNYTVIFVSLLVIFVSVFAGFFAYIYFIRKRPRADEPATYTGRNTAVVNIFNKLIKHSIKKGLEISDSAISSEMIYLFPAGEARHSFRLLATIYNRAAFSNEEVTPTELAEARSLFRKLIDL